MDLETIDATYMINFEVMLRLPLVNLLMFAYELNAASVRQEIYNSMIFWYCRAVMDFGITHQNFNYDWRIIYLHVSRVTNFNPNHLKLKDLVEDWEKNAESVIPDDLVRFYLSGHHDYSGVKVSKISSYSALKLLIQDPEFVTKFGLFDPNLTEASKNLIMSATKRYNEDLVRIILENATKEFNAKQSTIIIFNAGVMGDDELLSYVLNHPMIQIDTSEIFEWFDEYTTDDDKYILKIILEHPLVDVAFNNYEFFRRMYVRKSSKLISGALGNSASTLKDDIKILKLSKIENHTKKISSFFSSSRIVDVYNVNAESLISKFGRFLLDDPALAQIIVHKSFQQKSYGWDAIYLAYQHMFPVFDDLITDRTITEKHDYQEILDELVRLTSHRMNLHFFEKVLKLGGDPDEAMHLVAYPKFLEKILKVTSFDPSYDDNKVLRKIINSYATVCNDPVKSLKLLLDDPRLDIGENSSSYLVYSRSLVLNVLENDPRFDTTVCHNALIYRVLSRGEGGNRQNSKIDPYIVEILKGKILSSDQANIFILPWLKCDGLEFINPLGAKQPGSL